MNSFDKYFRLIWLWSLGFFILAILTGFLFRLGLVTSLPAELSFSNIRHAHSHLMFFNWVVPIPMAFIARHLAKTSGQSMASLRFPVYFIMALGFLSYPFFLFYGYRPVQMGEASLPLSVILSGLVMIGWYWFMWIYLLKRKSSENTLPRLFYDAALLILGVSSLGAWGVAVFQFSGSENPLFSTALTHFFLAVFTEGWCLLAALGIFYDVLGIEKVAFPQNWLMAPVLLGVPLMFPFGMSAGMLTPSLLIAARIGSAMVLAGLVFNLWVLMNQRLSALLKVIVCLLGLKILMQAGSAILPTSLWIGEHSLRILYLHLLLLGFVSLTFMAGLHRVYREINRSGLYLILFSVLLLIVSLVMLSRFWPHFLMPENPFKLVAWIAFLPVLAVSAEWVLLYQYHKFKSQ
ncbi:MAG: hypothetical protein WD735_07115 [Balneolaceae bacterium]